MDLHSVYTIQELYCEVMGSIFRAPPMPFATLTPGVPRVVERRGPVALACGLGLLLLLAALGATLVHTMEYHLGLGSQTGPSAAEAMLAQCPLRGGLLVMVLVTVAAALAIAYEVRRLTRQRRALLRLAGEELGSRASRVALPRQPIRVVQVFVPLIALQAGMYGLFDQLWPMGPLMRMNGAFMHMASQGALPLAPVHLIVAALIAVLVWRLERRVTVLRAIIAAVCRLLARMATITLRVPLPILVEQCASVPVGIAGLPRPPPATLACGL
jgi:hypothetical protein